MFERPTPLRATLRALPPDRSDRTPDRYAFVVEAVTQDGKSIDVEYEVFGQLDELDALLCLLNQLISRE